MVSREKMFIVASNLDDSIKSQTTVYDITLFKTFIGFERFIDSVPVIVDTIIITSDELKFSSSSMQRVYGILNSPFLRLTGNVVYLIDESVQKDTVVKFFETNGWKNWIVYQGDLSPKFITSIVTGECRQSVEVQSERVTYRMRASEYIKQKSNISNQNNEGKYLTDEDVLSDIPVEEDEEELIPRVDLKTTVNYIVGDTLERTVMVFLLAQYRALAGKTLIVEKDWEFHTLTDMVTKSGIQHLMIYIEEFNEDAYGCIDRIRRAKENLIVIGCKNRKEFSYNFIVDVLESNLKGELSYIIRECDYSETPYGMFYTVVMSNTVPEVLRSCNMLRYRPRVDSVTFIGMQLNDLGPVNISSNEMGAVISTVLEVNGIMAQTIRVSGIKLKGEDSAYDILGIINRGN